MKRGQVGCIDYLIIGFAEKCVQIETETNSAIVPYIHTYVTCKFTLNSFYCIV